MLNRAEDSRGRLTSGEWYQGSWGELRAETNPEASDRGIGQLITV